MLEDTVDESVGRWILPITVFSVSDEERTRDGNVQRSTVWYEIESKNMISRQRERKEDQRWSREQYSERDTQTDGAGNGTRDEIEN